MDIRSLILINQLAQGIVDAAVGKTWFLRHDADAQKNIILEVNAIIQQSHPHLEDFVAADPYRPRSLRSFVMHSSHDASKMMCRFPCLSATELLEAFVFQIAVLGASDGRRRAQEPIDLKNHWWHRDLRDPSVIEEIVEEYRRS